MIPPYRTKLAGFLLLVLFACIPANAQEDPLTEQGLKPYGSFHGGDIDDIILSNGKLNLHIPLISYPQGGGKLNFGFFLNYTNSSFSSNTVCGGNVCKTFWGWGGSGVQIQPDFANLVGGNVAGAGIAVQTPDQSWHGLWTTSNNFMSIDTTSFNWNTATSVLTDRNGIRSFYTPSTSESPTKIEDPDGNEITPVYNTNGAIASWTDTMGKVIPVPPFASGSNGNPSTTNFSGCSGSQPTSTAYLWNLPAPGGATATYKVCIANVTLVYPQSGCNASANCFAVDTPTPFIQSIVLPNNTAWSFSYDSLGNLDKITLPTGGSVSYGGWSQISFLCSGSGGSTGNAHLYWGAIQSRTVNANDGSQPQTWTYARSGSGQPSFTITVTDPLGDQTVRTLSQFPANIWENRGRKPGTDGTFSDI